MPEQKFFLKKMPHTLGDVLNYSLGDINLNEFIGKEISLKFSGLIQCVYCQRKIKKTFGDGFCFPCFQTLARCDLCILKPELCHFRHGTCREPEWGKENCLIPHIIYLSNAAGLKVGITRWHKRFERWGDQGATQAIILAKVPERYFSGLIELELKKHLKDKADWRGLLKGANTEIDMLAEKRKCLSHFPQQFAEFVLDDDESNQVFNFAYPVTQYLKKAVSLSFAKESELKGSLLGIRGQYLMVGDKALNVRKHSGYEVIFTS